MDRLGRVLRIVLGFLARSARRIAVLVVGIAVILVGIVMLVTPGPAVLVIPAGLAILATEFKWAETLLMGAKRHTVAARRKALERINRRRARRGRPEIHEIDVGPIEIVDLDHEEMPEEAHPEGQRRAG